MPSFCFSITVIPDLIGDLLIPRAVELFIAGCIQRKTEM